MVKNVKEYINSPFLYDQWYVAGEVKEFDQSLKCRTLLEKSILFYRTKSGELVALQNRCLHRAFPLSNGKKEGDNVMCGYHGARYNPEGELVRVALQDKPPKKKLRKYPICEIGHLVLIWMGEGEADESKLPKPSFSFLADPKFRTVNGYFHLEGSYLFMQENLHDLTHVPFLHGESFGVDERFNELNLPLEVEQTDRGIEAKRTHVYNKRHFLAPTVLKALEGKDLWRIDVGVATSPGVFESKVITGIGRKEGDGDTRMNQYIMHYLTPETKTTSHYWWAVSLDHGTETKGNEEYWNNWARSFSIGFVEDVAAVKQMQTFIENDNDEFEDVHFAGDKHGMMFRRLFAQWLQDEYGD
jgi:vanillate O-demethylase monooxygenase subunit